MKLLGWINDSSCSLLTRSQNDSLRISMIMNILTVMMMIELNIEIQSLSGWCRGSDSKQSTSGREVISIN